MIEGGEKDSSVEKRFRLLTDIAFDVNYAKQAHLQI